MRIIFLKLGHVSDSNFSIRIRQRINPFADSSKSPGDRSGGPGRKNDRLDNNLKFKQPKTMVTPSMPTTDEQMFTEMSTRVAMDDIVQFNSEKAQGKAHRLSAQDLSKSDEKSDEMPYGLSQYIAQMNEPVLDDSRSSSPPPTAWHSPLESPTSVKDRHLRTTRSATKWDLPLTPIDLTADNDLGWMSQQIKELSYAAPSPDGRRPTEYARSNFSS